MLTNRTNKTTVKKMINQYTYEEGQEKIDGNMAQTRSVTSHHKSKKATLFIVIATILVAWFLISFLSNIFTWKAVFLDSNQVFFGKFVNIPFASTITLRNAHFIKPEQADISSSTPQNQSIIISEIGEMPHGPADDMVISKDHILYYENLKSGSSLVKGLEQSENRK